LTILIGTYCIGLGLLLGRLGVAGIRIRDLKRKIEPIRCPKYLDVLYALKKRYAIQEKVELVTVTDLSTPIQIGIFQPIILIPDTLLQQASQTTLKAILAHKLAHIRRRDYLFNLAAALVQALYWYNPLVWLAAQHARALGEYACDDWTVSLAADHHDYSHLLLGITADTRVQSPPLFTVGMARPSQLARRLDRLAYLDGATFTQVHALAAKTVIVGLLALVLLLGTTALYAQSQRTDSVATDSPTNGLWNALIQIKNELPGFYHPSPNPYYAQLKSRDPKIRQQAAMNLLRFGTTTVPRLIEESQSDYTRVRYIAVQLLGRFKDHRALPALVKALGDPSANVAHKAAWALGALGSYHALEPLLQCADDASPRVRRRNGTRFRPMPFLYPPTGS
jgi:beta-lactamase regulating signal transducer with metallopeptidase domain